MKLASILLIAMLLFLSSCVDGGAHRSYIISDMGDNAAGGGEHSEQKK